MKKKPIKKPKSKRTTRSIFSGKHYTKTVCIETSVKTSATPDEYERYEAFLVTFGNFLFQKKIGTWGGSEVALSKSKFAKTTYWYILEHEADHTKRELKRMSKNFRLNAVLKVDIGLPMESNVDYEKQISKEKKFSWAYYRI